MLVEHRPPSLSCNMLKSFNVIINALPTPPTRSLKKILLGIVLALGQSPGLPGTYFYTLNIYVLTGRKARRWISRKSKYAY
jgi:hypothetical protein